MAEELLNKPTIGGILFILVVLFSFCVFLILGVYLNTNVIPIALIFGLLIAIIFHKNLGHMLNPKKTEEKINTSAKSGVEADIKVEKKL